MNKCVQGKTYLSRVEGRTIMKVADVAVIEVRNDRLAHDLRQKGSLVFRISGTDTRNGGHYRRQRIVVRFFSPKNMKRNMTS